MDRRRFLRSAGLGVLGGLAAPAAAAPQQPPPLAAAAMTVANVRQTLSLEDGWRSHLGDIPMPTIRGHGWSYANAKAGNAKAPRR